MEPNFNSELCLATLFKQTFELERQECIQLSIYLPDRDLDNRRVRVRAWQKKINKKLNECFGGSSVAKVRGFYLLGHTLIKERTLVISCYLSPERFTEGLRELKPLLDGYFFHSRQECLLLVLADEVFYYRPARPTFEVE